MNPLASVVFPAPRSPASKTICGARISRVRRRPSSIVSSGERVRCFLEGLLSTDLFHRVTKPATCGTRDAHNPVSDLCVAPLLSNTRSPIPVAQGSKRPAAFSPGHNRRFAGPHPPRERKQKPQVSSSPALRVFKTLSRASRVLTYGSKSLAQSADSMGQKSQDVSRQHRLLAPFLGSQFGGEPMEVDRGGDNPLGRFVRELCQQPRQSFP